MGSDLLFIQPKKLVADENQAATSLLYIAEFLYSPYALLVQEKTIEYCMCKIFHHCTSDPQSLIFVSHGTAFAWEIYEFGLFHLSSFPFTDTFLSTSDDTHRPVHPDLYNHSLI